MARASRDPVTVEGRVEPGFEAVRDAFERNFAEHGDVGAACCLYVDGRPVVDIWGGVADPESNRRWQRDTLTLVYSTTKGVTAMALNLLAQRGEVDFDAPVREYWPEFGIAGKASIPLRYLPAHRAGLPVVEGEFTLDDVRAWVPIVTALAGQEPRWEPGAKHGYHMRTYGWLVGEIIRRVTGSTPGAFVREELGEPLGLDFWIGLPEELDARCAAIVPSGGESDDVLALLPAGTLLAEAIPNPSGLFAYDTRWNRREYRAVELPSSNGVGDARSLARLYASAIGEVDGVRTLRPETVAQATEVQARGPDEVLMIDTCYGLGFMLAPFLDVTAGPRAFGHAGAGGSLALADPDTGLGFAYVMNQMRFDARGDPRAASLVRSAYEALGAR